MFLPMAPKQCGKPSASNSWTNPTIFTLVIGKLFKYTGAKTCQTSSQKLSKILQTLDIPTPNILAIVRYSADEPNAYIAIATLFSKGIAVRMFVSFLRSPDNN